MGLPTDEFLQVPAAASPPHPSQGLSSRMASPEQLTGQPRSGREGMCLPGAHVWRESAYVLAHVQ